MQINNFKEMYYAELSELRSAEEQRADALPRMREAARHDELKKTLTWHIERTQHHRDRLESLMRRHNVNPQEHRDQSMRTLIGEAEKMAGILTQDDLRDAGIIASTQRLGHYEIATYGTLATYADMLGFQDDKSELFQMLEEEKEADKRLTMLAETVVNKDAIGRA